MGDPRPRKIEETLGRELVLIVSMIALALVQTTLLPTPTGFPPALVLILVVCRILLGIGSGAPEDDLGMAIRWAFYGGIALDICAATPIGSHALALLLAALLAVLLSSRLRIGGALVPLAAVLLGTVAYEITLALIYHLTVTTLDWSRHATVILIPSVLLTLIPTLPIFHLMRWHMQKE